jgi:hypothetical protein
MATAAFTAELPPITRPRGTAQPRRKNCPGRTTTYDNDIVLAHDRDPSRWPRFCLAVGYCAGRRTPPACASLAVAVRDLAYQLGPIHLDRSIDRLGLGPTVVLTSIMRVA